MLIRMGQLKLKRDWAAEEKCKTNPFLLAIA
jgi:hypothetical protein